MIASISYHMKFDEEKIILFNNFIQLVFRHVNGKGSKNFEFCHFKYLDRNQPVRDSEVKHW